jgi:hypothetical protein
LEIEEVTLLLVYTLLKVVVEVAALVQVRELVAVLVAERQYIKAPALLHKQVLESLRATEIQVDQVVQHGLVQVVVVQAAQA